MSAIVRARAARRAARRLRIASLVRTLLVFGSVAALVIAAAPATAEPLWQAEIRAGYGVATGGSGARMSTRKSPLTLAAIAAFAFNEEPLLYGYGGLLVETLDRNEAGATFGIRYSPRGSRLRLSGGGTWMVAPESLFGATASGGVCMRWKPTIGLCGDIQLTAFVAGSDLAPGRAITQAQLVAGMVFDAL